MRVLCHAGGDEPPVAREQWQELLAGNETNTPFQTWEWLISWWRAFGEQHLPLIFTAHEGDRLIGVAPLMVSRRPHGSTVIEFAANERSDYCDILCHGDKETFLAEVLQQLRQQVRGRIVHLRNIPEHSSTVAILDRCCERLELPVIRDMSLCPTLVLARCEDLERISLPRSLRRHLAYLQNTGGLSFQVLSGREEALASLDTFFQQHRERWQSTKFPSLFGEETNCRFYRELVKQASESGWLFFSRLDYGTTPIAFHFGFDYGAIIYWYKPSFARAYAKRSPGRIMIKYLIDYCVKNDRSEFDFTLGQEEFKNYYANDQKRIVSLKMFLNKKDYLWEQGFRKVRGALKSILHSVADRR